MPEQHPRSSKTRVRDAKPAVKAENGHFGIFLPDPLLAWQGHGTGGTVIVLRAGRLGGTDVDGELGEALLRSFLQAIISQAEPPACLVLYGSAVLLAGAEHPLRPLIGQLHSKKCEVLICHTSWTALLPGQEATIGHLADWTELADRMVHGQHVLWPS